MASVQTVLKDVGFQYTTHTFDRHPTDPVRGAYESHMSLFRYAAEHDLPWIAIIEDNIRLASDDSTLPKIPSDERYQFMKDRLMSEKQKTDWEVMIFGGCTIMPTTFAKTSDPYVLSTRGTCLGCFGYVISKAGYLRMLDVDRLGVNMPIDFLIQESKYSDPTRS